METAAATQGEPTVLVERQSDRIALVTLNRPTVHNALDSELAGRLVQVVAELAADASLRVVVFTGAGDKAFVAGGDIGEFKTRTAATAVRVSQQRQELFRTIETMPAASIAAINGYAFGGGLELAMACTLRVASTRARLGQPELNLGIIPGAGGTQRLPRLVGKGRALDLILTGRTVDAEEGLHIGLVDRVTAPESLVEEALALAETIAAKAPLAARLARRAVDAAFDSPLADGTVMESAFLGLCFASEDLREGIAAFEEKRPADFQGK